MSQADYRYSNSQRKANLRFYDIGFNCVHTINDNIIDDV